MYKEVVNKRLIIMTFEASTRQGRVPKSPHTTCSGKLHRACKIPVAAGGNWRVREEIINGGAVEQGRRQQHHKEREYVL